MKPFLALITLLFSASAYAEVKSMPGKQLHDEACIKCHGAEMYTREDRFVHSITDLSKQVSRCQHNLGISWFDDERDSVVKFLNNNYYKFK